MTLPPNGRERHVGDALAVPEREREVDGRAQGVLRIEDALVDAPVGCNLRRAVPLVVAARVVERVEHVQPIGDRHVEGVGLLEVVIPGGRVRLVPVRARRVGVGVGLHEVGVHLVEVERALLADAEELVDLGASVGGVERRDAQGGRAHVRRELAQTRDAHRVAAEVVVDPPVVGVERGEVILDRAKDRGRHDRRTRGGGGRRRGRLSRRGVGGGGRVGSGIRLGLRGGRSYRGLVGARGGEVGVARE